MIACGRCAKLGMAVVVVLEVLDEDVMPEMKRDNYSLYTRISRLSFLMERKSKLRGHS